MTLGKFNNSLNFIFGLSGLASDIDVLNNPYIRYAAFSERKEPTIHPFYVEEVYELEICAQDHLDKFMERNWQYFYS